MSRNPHSDRLRALIGVRIAELDQRWQRCLVASSIAIGAALLAGCGGDVAEPDTTDGSGGNQATGGVGGGAHTGGAGGGATGGTGGHGPSSECGADQDCTVTCFDEVDNDVDGLADCDDADCLSYCLQPAYGIPYEANCQNLVDDDMDGRIDCDDADCVGSAPCAGQAIYSAPIEDCTNNLDDDGDWAMDCGDPDCAEAVNCLGQRYATPIEVVCMNGQDDDGDGLYDCADGDCASDIWCTDSAVPLYAVPF